MTTEEQDLIDRAMDQLREVLSANTEAMVAVGEGNLVEARAALADTSNHTNHARRALRHAGARIPSLDEVPRKPKKDKYDLAELTALSSQSGFQLLAGLNQLQELADAYDGERGKTYQGGGTDFGEAIEMLRSRLRQLLGIRAGGRE